MAWLILILAGALEVVWSTALKQSDGFTRFIPAAIMVAAALASLWLLALAMRALPLGTAYAVWTGIGAVGAFAVGIVWLGEAATPLRLVAAALVLSGIVLFKLSEPAA